MRFGIRSRVFGTNQEDLDRVVDPQEDNEQSASGSITRCHTAASDIKSNEGLADRE